MIGGLLERLERREDLTADQAAAALDELVDGSARPAQVAGLLVGLAIKGERAAEIVGFARAMRARSTPLSRRYDDLVDTCGTGGDGGVTFNVSTVAAIVVAACGATVAKHGNRSVSSRCGSADVLEALGVRIDAPPAVVERCLERAGVAFLFAPIFHPSMRNVAGIRRELGVPTVFNLLGPLTNPAGATRQVVGVPRPELTELLARALGQLGAVRAWVVHGADGLDEISTTGHTKVSEWRGGSVRTFYLHPSEAGLPTARLGALAGGDAKANADRTHAILAGEPGPARDVVLMNAGAALLIAGRAGTVREGVERAAEAIDSGRAAATLDALVRVSRETA